MLPKNFMILVIVKDSEYNPDAVDGDGDGIVQEGTEFERPVE